jgi:hypothetical protein
MKIRNGFVSNSSSSSFLIKTDENINEVKQFLENCIKFGNNNGLNEYIESSYEMIFDEPFDPNSDSEFIEQIKYYLNEYNVNIKDYNIVVNSVGDNSVPYWMFDIIGTKYCCRRLHLG